MMFHEQAQALETVKFSFASRLGVYSLIHSLSLCWIIIQLSIYSFIYPSFIHPTTFLGGQVWWYVCGLLSPPLCFLTGVVYLPRMPWFLPGLWLDLCHARAGGAILPFYCKWNAGDLQRVKGRRLDSRLGKGVEVDRWGDRRAPEYLCVSLV